MSAQRRRKPVDVRRLLRTALAAFALGNVVLLTTGALLLAYGPAWFRDAVFRETGAAPVMLEPDGEFVWLALLVACPLLLVGSMLVTVRTLWRPADDAAPAGRRLPAWTYLMLAVVVGALPTIRAAQGMMGTLDSFGNFDLWKAQRWKLFDELSFPDFVVLYSLVPSLALAAIASASACGRPTRRLELVAAGLSSAAVLAIDFSLAMKKQVSMHVLMAGLVLYLGHAVGKRVMLGTAAAVLAVFIVSVYLSGSAEAIESGSASGGASDPLVQSMPNSLRLAMDALPEPDGVSVFLLHSLTSRSALPTFYYVDCFPKVYEFTGPNIPFIGTQSKTFHNELVNSQMYPGQPGTSYSGWAFALFAEGGLPFALMGTVLLGAGSGIWWVICGRFLRAERLIVAQALTASFLLLLNTDDWVNNAVSSYGIIYPTAMLFAIEWVVGARGRHPAPVGGRIA